MAAKQYHEIRDPIHVFVRLDSDERRVLDSGPVQRLRHIHQLAMSYLVYPGATHKRFEHSLGVMELAGRVFDVVTAEPNIHPSVREVVPEIGRSDSRDYWRKVLRMAALCHDIGHLPFSHASEGHVLPDGWDHERISAELIQSGEVAKIWSSMRPPLIAEDVAKIAVGPEKMKDVRFSTWETLLSEIITGEAFGVDRMDYLLRDSHHAGVAYGKFDHYRLIDTIRLLPGSSQTGEPTLGVGAGGIHSAEALLLARYFMFMQVYLHSVRLAYDFHLREFLQVWLPEGRFTPEKDASQLPTDNEIISAIARSAEDQHKPGHEAANRILSRRHFRRLYIQTRADKEKCEELASVVAKACKEKFGKDKVRLELYRQSEPVTEFPVLDSGGAIVSSHDYSDTLQHTPIVDVGIVFVDPECVEEAKNWLSKTKDDIFSEATKGL